MLLFGYSLPRIPAVPSKPPRAAVTFQNVHADTLAPTPYTECHHAENVVDGLSHYIEYRICDERFRID